MKLHKNFPERPGKKLYKMTMSWIRYVDDLIALEFPLEETNIFDEPGKRFIRALNFSDKLYEQAIMADTHIMYHNDFDLGIVIKDMLLAIRHEDQSPIRNTEINISMLKFLLNSINPDSGQFKLTPATTLKDMENILSNYRHVYMFVMKNFDAIYRHYGTLKSTKKFEFDSAMRALIPVDMFITTNIRFNTWYDEFIKHCRIACM